MLYCNVYWLLYILALRFVLLLCTTAISQFVINEYVMLCYVTRGTVTRLWCEQRSQSRPEVKPLIPRMASPSPHPLHHYHRQSPNYRRAEIARCLATGLHHWSTGRLSGRSARAVGDGWSTAILFISLLDDDDDSYTSPSQCSPLHLTASWAGPVMNRPGWSNAAAGAGRPTGSNTIRRTWRKQSSGLI